MQTQRKRKLSYPVWTLSNDCLKKKKTKKKLILHPHCSPSIDLLSWPPTVNERKKKKTGIYVNSFVVLNNTLWGLHCALTLLSVPTHPGSWKPLESYSFLSGAYHYPDISYTSSLTAAAGPSNLQPGNPQKSHTCWHPALPHLLAFHHLLLSSVLWSHGELQPPPSTGREKTGTYHHRMGLDHVCKGQGCCRSGICGPPGRSKCAPLVFGELAPKWKRGEILS